ncbi:hypothetical protein EX30DRAFT_352855 [Ascodesmis nigricans]|uniref:Uncharacterized protein n=1 Tax=Ascodesmis nigricans TaxID=341454 RepID=A0A4S2MHD4_9PEZI|nr:hypothetical protein EX30DRAFT_352855 [Ascodesmis nigricans]
MTLSTRLTIPHAAHSTPNFHAAQHPTTTTTKSLRSVFASKNLRNLFKAQHASYASDPTAVEIPENHPEALLLTEAMTIQSRGVTGRGFSDPEVYVAAISPTHPSVALYEENLDDITAALNQLDIAWVSIELLNASKDGLHFAPTLLVGVHENCIAQQRDRASHVVQEFAFRIGVAGAVIANKVELQGGSGIPLHERMFRPGEQLSRVETEKSGSIGGFLKIGEKIYLLTCHHVAYSGLYPRYHKNGAENIIAVPRGESRVQLVSPAWSTLQKIREIQTKHFEDAKRALNEHLEYCQAQGIFPTMAEALNHDVEKNIKELMTPLESSSLGKVWYDCGELRVVKWRGRETRQDWVLMLVSEDKHGDCSNTVYSIGRLWATIFPNKIATITRYHTFQRLENAGPINLHKMGAATQQTMGEFSGVRSRISLDLDHCPAYARTYSDELVICPTGAEVFSRGGDSGSWVFGDNEEWFDCSYYLLSIPNRSLPEPEATFGKSPASPCVRIPTQLEYLPHHSVCRMLELRRNSWDSS